MGQIVSDILLILKAVSSLGKENGEGVNLEWENIRFEMWGITLQEFYEAALQNLKKVEPNVLCLGDLQEPEQCIMGVPKWKNKIDE